MSDAASRVRAAIEAGTPPSRRDLEHALRQTLGMSARLAKRFCSEGARAVTTVDEIDATAVLDDLRGLLQKFTPQAENVSARTAFDTNGASSTLKESADPDTRDTRDER